MDIQTALITAVVMLVPALIIQTGRASYYSGKFEQLEEDVVLGRATQDGWEDEAKFWRNVAFPEAEAKRIGNE